MYVELLDRLRCTGNHADTWLVAAATRTEHRHLVEATLGCPACDATFEVRNGEVWLGDAIATAPMPVNDDEAMRAAALLRLEERGLYLLDGGWASLAHAIREIVDVDLILSDPPAGAAPDGQGTLRGVGSRWPLAAASLHGVALAHATAARVSDAVRVLRAGGRLVAPVDASLPAGVRELASDDRHWVAEKLPDVVPLSRARR
jgi:hypothetical protein